MKILTATNRIRCTSRRRAFLFLLCLLSSCTFAFGQSTYNPDGTPHSAPPEPRAWRAAASELKIALVGDSTVQASSGWGDGFAAWLKPNAECINLAKGGRSTRTFREEGRWAQALDLHPDVIILGFGHNDLQPKPDRHVSLEDFRANLFRFVHEARAAKIRVVLMTPIAYRHWSDDDKLLPTKAEVAAYDQATRDVAKQESLPLLDLAVLTAGYYQRMGRKVMDTYSMQTKGVVDPAHLNHAGGIALGALIADHAQKNIPWLAPYINPPTPTE